MKENYWRWKISTCPKLARSCLISQQRQLRWPFNLLNYHIHIYSVCPNSVFDALTTIVLFEENKPLFQYYLARSDLKSCFSVFCCHCQKLRIPYFYTLKKKLSNYRRLVKLINSVLYFLTFQIFDYKSKILQCQNHNRENFSDF